MPSEPAYKVIDRRGLGTYAGSLMFSEAVRSRNSGQRKFVSQFNKDAPGLLGYFTRNYLLNVGRWLYQNTAPVKAAINEMSMLASSGIQQQFDGTDIEWGKQAEEWLFDHDRICDVRGRPFNMDAIRDLIVVSWLRDGDCFILLTESEDGFPLFQILPGHRCGSVNDGIVAEGAYKGRVIQDGVIVNDFGRPIAYRFTSQDYLNYRDVPASSVIPCFIPEYADQLRGVSPLACAVMDFQDVGEARRMEMVSQKVFSGMSLIVHNEEGGPADTANSLQKYMAGGFTSDGDVNLDGPEVAVNEILPGEIRYFRAGSGSKVEAVTGDRPTQNQRDFVDQIHRQSLAGIGWSFDFTLDPTKAGGAQMRLVIEKLNRRLSQVRRRMLYPAMRQMDGYRIAKAIKLGLLPESEEWYKWEYISPAELTADKKYDSQVALEEYKAGLSTFAEACGRSGRWGEDVLAKRAVETADFIRAAKKVAEETQVPLETAMTLMRDTSSYSTLTNSASATAEAQNGNNNNQE